jgi:pimeloyl-ACP methyl ester carboxylesterase
MSVLDQLLAMPTLGCALPFNGFVRYREAGAGAAVKQAPIVLLHGIGSGSGSWVRQLQADTNRRVLAWDAPGYADSTPLKNPDPLAQDYAQVLLKWLDELQIREVHLVGHSLGCIMAASTARLQPARIRQLTLLAPAQGYGAASHEIQAAKRDERIKAMQQLGLAEMARQRAPRLLALNAPPEQLQLATHMMSHLNEEGYAQATRMLSAANIRADLQAFRSTSNAPIRVACGDLDVITPPAACQALAEHIQAPYTSLPGAGHVCPLEAPAMVNTLLSLN